MANELKKLQLEVEELLFKLPLQYLIEIAKLLKLDTKSKTRRQTVKCINTELDNQVESATGD